MNVEHERLKEILAEAAGKATPEARAAYLDAACQGDAALRQQVEALLAAHERAGDFLEKTVELPPSDIVIERTGTMIGRYKLLERIGEGGFGVVFMAEQQEPLQRKVALKIIKAGMDTREVIARFEAERQALALMDHPNIAKIFDAGVTGAPSSQPSTLNSQLVSGRPYFVMELVRGIPITEYCDQSNLPTADRLQLFMQVCHAVQHAHQKGIIHRDLKPTNILVTVIDGQPVPKIIDFGVAKALGQKLTQRTLFTGFQQMIGTPAYMSPEQAALSGVDVDTRSDIYALGVLLYELLTSETPFDKETLHKAALDEIRRLIRETEPLKPSTRLRTLGDKLTAVAQCRHTEPTALTRLVHGDLDWIVMKALEKDRARRYETANDLARDLERHLEHQPVVAGPPGAVYRARKFIRRHRLGVAFAAAVVVALALGLMISLIGFAQARHQRDRAEQLARQESEQRQRAEASAKAARTEKELAAANLQMAQISLIQHHLDDGQIGPALALLEAQRPTVNMQDSRSIEWRHLWWRAHQGHRFTLRGHEGAVSAVVCLPNGSLVASGGADGTVKLWDMGTGLERATLVRNQAAIRCLAVSPDAKTLAWGDDEGVLTVWDLPQGRLRATVRAHNDTVRNLAFSPDSQLIASCSGDATARLWQVETGESAGSPLPYGNTEPLSEPWMNAVAFSPDGQTLACAEFGSVALWDVTARKVQARLHRHRNSIANLAFTPDGKTLVSGGNDSTVKLWDVAAAREMAKWLPSIRQPVCMALSPDGSAVAIGGDCGTIEVRDLASEHTKTYGHVGRVNSVAFSPDGRTLTSAGDDGAVKLWDLTQERNLPPLHGRQTLGWSVAYSPDGKTLAAAGDPDPELWDVSSGRLLGKIPVGGCAGAAFTPDGKVLACGNRLWDVASERRLPSLPKDGLAAAFSRDGETLMLGCLGAGQEAQRTDITLWDWKTGQKRATLSGHRGWVLSLAVSPDGLTVASASVGHPRNTEVILWEIPSGRRIRTLEHGYVCVAFSPDGKTLATGSKSGGIALWDPVTGTLLKDMVGHVSFMRKLAFAPDGKTIVSCNVQGGVTLWDIERGIERATLTRSGHSVYSTAFSPDGQTFATGGQEGTLEIWRTATAAEVRAQSDCFDPRLRLARKYQAEARALRMGLRPQDAVRAGSQAESIYEELAAEFPERTDYRYSRLANQNDLVSLAAHGTGPLEDTNRWLALADKAVELASRDTSQLSGLLRPALLNRFNLLQRVSRLSGAAAEKSYAQKLGEEVLTVVRRVLGPDHPETLRTMHDLAVAYQSQGEMGQARALGEAALPGLRRVLGPDHPETLRVMQELAAVYQKEGKFSEAEVLYRQALQILRTQLPAKDPELAAWLALFAHLLLVEEKFADAEPLARECLAIHEKLLPDDWLTFNARSMLGGSLLGQKKFAEAEPLLLSGYEGMKQREARIPAIGKPRLKETLQRLVQLYESTGRADQAAEWQQKLAEFEQAQTAKQPAAPPR